MTSPITHLWIAVRNLFARMRAAVGDAAQLAQQVELPASQISAARAWLRTLELMVRKLVLIEARALLRPERLPVLRHVVELRQRVTAKLKPARRSSVRRYTFRLWPRPKPHPARIRMLGPPVLVREVWRDQARAAQALQLNIVRFLRTPEPQRIARRIEALERVLAAPARAAQRLARRLKAAPATAQLIALQPPPRRSCADPALENEIGARAFVSARADTS